MLRGAGGAGIRRMNLIFPLFGRIIVASEQFRTVAVLPDTLLSNLISGALPVIDAERMIAVVST
jgi:hypothetical protein